MPTEGVLGAVQDIVKSSELTFAPVASKTDSVYRPGTGRSLLFSPLCQGSEHLRSVHGDVAWQEDRWWGVMTAERGTPLWAVASERHGAGRVQEQH